MSKFKHHEFNFSMMLQSERALVSIIFLKGNIQWKFNLFSSTYVSLHLETMNTWTEEGRNIKRAYPTGMKRVYRTHVCQVHART